MPSRPPAALLAFVLGACSAPADHATVADDDDPVVELPAPPRKQANQADFEAAWVRVSEPPTLGAVPPPPGACVLGTEDANTPECEQRRLDCRGRDSQECQAMYASCDEDSHPDNPNCVIRRPACERPGVRCNPPPPN